VWYGVRCHGASWCYDKTFKGGEERVYSVMCLRACFGAELVGGESVMYHVYGLVPSWLEVRVLLSHESVCVMSRAMRGPSKSLAKVALRVTVIPSTRQGQSCLCHGLCR